MDTNNESDTISKPKEKTFMGFNIGALKSGVVDFKDDNAAPNSAR